MHTVKNVSIGFVVALLLAIALFPVPSTAQTSKKIVFLAASKDHGVPGRHEYEKDLRVLAYCLEHASNLKGISTKVLVGRAPAFDELKDAALIVVEGDGDRSAREVNPLFPPTPPDKGPYSPETVAFLKDFDGLMKKGTGLVFFTTVSRLPTRLHARTFWNGWAVIMRRKRASETTPWISGQ